jgi:hypothetical protein
VFQGVVLLDLSSRQAERNGVCDGLRKQYNDPQAPA